MMICSKKNADRLSKLPEEILSRILSLMPTKFAVRTSVLSKRWRHTWTFVTNLDFDLDAGQRDSSFSEFVDRVLKLCKSSQINLLRIHLSYNTATQKSNVSNWIDKAVKLNVREIHINFPMFEFPLSFFTCKTLTKLRLFRSGYDHGVRECPCPVNLPSLKILDIIYCEDHPCVNTFKLIKGCPMLECLSLQVSSEIDYRGYTFNIPTLKRLQLVFLDCHRTLRVVLNVPNLEYLCVGGNWFPNFVVEDMPSLVEFEASIGQVAAHVWAKLLTGVSGVKSLSHGDIEPGSILPIFPNLKRLELKRTWRHGNIGQFLESCPELKHLYIEKYVGSGWLEPKSVPACLLTNLTTIKILNCKGWSRDIKFLEYILGNAKALKTVTIIWDKSRIKEEERLRAQLLNLTRASTCCEIQLY